ncbi:MAG: DUF2207 domain-containing protein [Sphaerochaetaceae bacterium]
MKFKTIVIFFIIVLCSFSLFAEAYEYEMLEYAVDINVKKDNVYEINTNYLFNFYTPKHGIYLDIPYLYDQRKVIVTPLSSSPNLEELEKSNGYIRYRFGTEDKTYIGEKDYFFNYSYDFGIDTNDGYDEFYFNIIGPVWQMPIKKCNFTITLPEGLENYDLHFTRGSYGSTDSSGIDYKREGNVITGTASDFQPGEALTIRVEMEDGYFVGARDFQQVKKNYFFLNLIVSVLLIFILFFLWSKYGKDDILIITAQSEPPKGLSPLEIGYLIDSTVDDKDITSMLFFWADKGYLRITETKVESPGIMKILKGKGTTVLSFEKIKDLDQGKSWEKYLFNEFFECGDGKTVTLEDIEGSKFYEVVGKIKLDVVSYYHKDHPVYNKKQNSLALIGIPVILISFVLTGLTFDDFSFLGMVSFIGFMIWVVQLLIMKKVSDTWEITKGKYIKMFLSFFPSVIFFGLIYIAGMLAYSYNFLITGIASTAVFITASLVFVFIKKRSPEGKALMESALGLREFIEKVEIDQLKMMIDDNPEFYYHVLSFAIVLGLEEKWAHKFDSLIVKTPDWYSGNAAVLTPLYICHMANNWNNGFATASMPPAPKSTSSGGSFSGSSGFSGGGFGGGGGGAW